MKGRVKPRKRRRQDSDGGASMGDSGINASQQLVGLLRFSQDPMLLMHGSLTRSRWSVSPPNATRQA